MSFISLIVHGHLKSFISFISFVFYISFRVQGPSILSILSFHLCFIFLSGCGDPNFFHFICVFHFVQGVRTFNSFNSFNSFVFFISFRVQGPSILSILSFHLCFSFLSGCRDLQFFQFFQGVGTFNSFNSFVFFISFRVRGPSFLSFLSILLCFHFFQGAGILNSFILFVFFISFRVLISFIFI